MIPEKKHFLTPLKGKTRPSRHLVLWIDADETQPVLKVRGNCAWCCYVEGEDVGAVRLGPWQGAAGLDTILDRDCVWKGTLTIWLARGWEDLVLSGLAELIDRGACSWRYALLDGQRVLVRGQWRGRSIVITSLANWLGPHWRESTKPREDAEVQRLVTAFAAETPDGEPLPAGPERQTLEAWLSLAAASHALGCTSLEPTVASAARQAWRIWMGPRLKVERSGKCKSGRKKDLGDRTIVLPSPYRPEAAALAERHVCYGLTYRQYLRGLYDAPVYAVDLKAAYALALAVAPLPARYERTLHRPAVDELNSFLDRRLALALVRLKTGGEAYPVRRAGKAFPATGHYWTWLCGTDLVRALADGHARECNTAYLWSAKPVASRVAETVLSAGDRLRDSGMPALADVWRSLYSSLVGQFAGRRKSWKDLPPVSGIDRWCQWYRADRTGHVKTCRSIAGRQQELADNAGPTSASVPLFYGAITSFVRFALETLANDCGQENVLATVADSLWVTKAGWQRLTDAAEKTGGPTDSLRCKAVYDRVWFSGGTATVVERKGIKFVRAPGCPDNACLDETGGYSQTVAVPWCESESVESSRGVGRRQRRFAGARLVERFGYPAVPLPIGEPLDDPLLPSELLHPPKYGRSVEDD